MRVVLDVDSRAGRDLLGVVDGANVMGLAEIVPCYDPVVVSNASRASGTDVLDEIRVDGKRLCPSVCPLRAY